MKNFKNIFITGGAGYVGASLVPRLLSEGFHVTVLDLMMYGENVLPTHPNLKVIKDDIRNANLLKKIIPGHDAVIHLACISNDPSFELNPTLGKSINLDSFKPLVEICKSSGVRRFIYASSSSVYGIKKETNVHEDVKLEPLTDYSKFKAECEKILLSYKSEDFEVVTVRPATVCGYSTRQRLDVIVNILTNYAYHKRFIQIFGGEQLRPNIHIKDMVETYLLFLKADKKLINGEIFNIGSKNMTVKEIAQIVKQIIGEDITFKVVETNDNRSYHISSKKILEVLNFETRYSIGDAVADLKDAFEKKLLTNTFENINYYNIKKMQYINLK